jgi:hypothetical protein
MKQKDFRRLEAAKNKGKPIENRLFLAVMAYFQQYLTAETNSSKIRVTFSSWGGSSK